MVLYLDEYKEQNPTTGKLLNYYDKLPEYLHEMPVEEIMKYINRNGERSRYFQKHSIFDYFMWLHKTYGINMALKNYELQQAVVNDDKPYIGFYTLEELKQAINSSLLKVEDENITTFPDYSGLVAIFYLEWYGVLPESAITIMLTDVSDDGKKVYIPAESRTIDITDNEVANYFAEYKQKKGFQRYKNSKDETLYTQNTFYRNTSSRGNGITERTIYNVRLKFVSACEDERFAKKRVYYSGRYYEMLNSEMKLGIEFTSTDDVSQGIICEIFNSKMSWNTIANNLREYRVFKKDYLERL